MATKSQRVMRSFWWNVNNTTYAASFVMPFDGTVEEICLSGAGDTATGCIQVGLNPSIQLGALADQSANQFLATLYGYAAGAVSTQPKLFLTRNTRVYVHWITTGSTFSGAATIYIQPV